MPELEVAKDAKINKNYKPTDKEQDLRKWVYKRKIEMEDAPERIRAAKVWDGGEKQWEQFRAERDRGEWNSNYVVPMTTSVVESILSEMVDQAYRPFILPRGAEDVWRAKIMEEIYDYSWQVANGDEEMKTVMRGGLIHGTAIAQEYYLKDRRKVRSITGLAKKDRRKRRDVLGKEEEVLEYDDVMMEWISPWDFLVDESAREINRGSYKARDCIRRMVMNYRDAEEFFAKDPVWDHLNNFRFVKPGGDTEYYQYYKPPQGIEHAEDVEVLWYWSRTPEDLLVVVINDVVVRMSPNPYKHKQLPFAKAVDVERIGKFYGKGEPEMLESIQEEADTLRRMVIDRHHLDIDKMFIGSQNMQLDEEDLIARPHGIIPGNPSDIQPIEYGDIPISIQHTFKSINDDKIAVTGVDDRFQSVAKTPSTATEAAILKESTLKRIRLRLANYQQGFLLDIGRMRMANILQFYSQPKLEKIVGEKGTEEFKRHVSDLARRGLIENRNGQLFEKRFRDITLEGKEIVPNEKGELDVKKSPGFSFFEAKPEYFMPVSRGGYDIRFEAGPSLPVSKPLMQSKVTEMFDRLIQIADPQLTNYDPEKLADELVRANDLNPEDLKRQEALETESIEQNRLELVIDLASQENQMALNGEPIPENGTPFAPPAHTQVHIEFLNSDAMAGVSQEIYMALFRHTMGEVEAIKSREAGGGQQSQVAGAAGGGANPLAGQNPGLPGLVTGGGQVPTGRVLNNG